MRRVLVALMVLAGCDAERHAALEVTPKAVRLRGEVLVSARDAERHDYLNIPELEEALKAGQSSCAAIDASAEVTVALAKRVTFSCGAAGKGQAVLMTPGAEVRLERWSRDVPQSLLVTPRQVTVQDQRRELSRTRLDEASGVSDWAERVVRATTAAATPGVLQVVVSDEVTLGAAVVLRRALERAGFVVSLVMP